MASVTNELHCCSDCASHIANDDISGIEYYGADYYAAWCKGVGENGHKFEGNPVIVCPEECAGDDAQGFNCDYCGRNVYSHKFNLTILN